VTGAANSLMIASAYALTAAKVRVAIAVLATAGQQADKPHFAHDYLVVKKENGS
jgi:hypothetical protein